MENELQRIQQRAQEHPEEKFTSLMKQIFDVEVLKASFRGLSGKKAPGVDGVRKDDYAKGVEEKIQDLSGRIRSMAYKPKPVRRVYIPKANGKTRPLGIPSFEDRIVQDRVAQVLSAIWEPEFRKCSHGFRPKRSAHTALRALHQVIMNEHTQYVVEADIKGFFDAVSHEHLMKFVNHRIADPKLLRLIRRFLIGGVMEDGAFKATEEGTPQGGLVSPVLSNIYLHYVLDLWFEKRFAKSCSGTARLVRYADDFVACFTEQQDAERFLVELKERLESFALQLESSKTKYLPFGAKMLGAQHPPTFSFLGITHTVTRSRKGRFKVGRRTDRKRFARSLKAVSAKLKALRTHGTSLMVAYIRRALQGHINYYGVSENSHSVGNYHFRIQRLLCHWLNRRSQRKSCRWSTFGSWWDSLRMPKPRIVHSFYPVAA